jgi:SAM-dependent methyltransferase
VADEGPDFYDNATVFERYMGQRHSTGSANDTIEGPVVRELIGDIRGNACLDLGCGDARFGSELLGGGAARYVGVEGSSLMFEAASRNVSDPRVRLVHADMRSWDYPVNEFDLVTSRLALHYIDEVDRIFSKVFQALKPSGRFVF